MGKSKWAIERGVEMKTPIKIIDRQFNFLGEIDEYESYIAVRSYHGVGSCQLVLHEDASYAKELQMENIIFTTPDKPYVILYRAVDSKTGKVNIQGRQLKSYLSRYITYPPLGQAYHRINAPAETIMKNIVTSNMAKQGIADVIVAPDLARGVQSVFQTRYKYISDDMEKIGLVSGLGWNVSLDFDSKKFVFDVVESLDRTAGQDINSRAIFALEYDNIQEQELVESKMNYANVAIVAGQGSGADRALVQVGDTTGLDRFELFVDARDIENDDDLPFRGQEKLAEMQEVKTFETEIAPDGNLVYEEDYNIGDLVTVQNKKWNITLDARINDITEVYEVDGFSLSATFGNNIPTQMSVLKQALDKPFVDESGGGEQTASEIPISSGNFESTNVEGALDELFTNVSNGKDLIATAITDKGGSASGSDTFGELASAIGQISSGKKWASGSTSVGGSTLSVRGLPFKPGVFFCKRTGSDSTSDGNRARSSIYVKKEVVGMSFDIIIGFGTATSLFLPNVATYEDGIDISVSLTGNYNWIAFE